VGELSFFDGHPRSGHVVTTEKCRLIQIPKNEIIRFLPSWYVQVGTNLTKKIRLLDSVVRENKIRSSESQDSKPLSMEEQRTLHSLLTN
jgi:CRP-like cAMP-binding protein